MVIADALGQKSYFCPKAILIFFFTSPCFLNLSNTHVYNFTNHKKVIKNEHISFKNN